MTKTLTQPQIDCVIEHINSADHPLAQIPARIVGQPILLSGGMRRSTFRINTDQGNYVLSISPASFPALQENHDLHEYLYKNGAPVVRPVGNMGRLPDDGDFTDARFEVCDFIEGRCSTHTRTTSDDMQAFGVALAKTHQLSERYMHDHGIDANHPATSWKVGAEYLRQADAAEKHEYKKWLREGVPVHRAIIESVHELRQRAYDMPDQRLVSGLVHRDAHPGNMIVAENGEALLIDLETCGKGAPFQDIAVAVLWGAAAPDASQGTVRTHIQQESVDAFFKGYESVKPLSIDEKKAIFTLIKNQAKASATLSNMGGFGPHRRDPVEYIGWASQVESWADRVTQLQKATLERT